MKGQVQVYRNLNQTLEDGTKVYSVRNDKNKVVDHVTEIALSRPVFRVGPKGNQRVRDEGRKNVHAYIQGRRMRESLMDDPTTGIRSDEWVKITYDPYEDGSTLEDLLGADASPHPLPPLPQTAAETASPPK